LLATLPTAGSTGWASSRFGRIGEERAYGVRVADGGVEPRVVPCGIDDDRNPAVSGGAGLKLRYPAVQG
jgi:hypothetical protein